MEITYIGHSCFKIKTKTATIITDPYDPKALGYRLPKLEADLVTVSHSHPDHANINQVEISKMAITTAGEYESMDVTVMGISTFHDDADGAKRGKNIIYLIEADGFNILHLGDLGHELTKETLEKLPSIDVLMIPVGGTYTIDSKVASKVISSIEPGIIIPMHYQTADLTALPEKLDTLDKFLHEMGEEDKAKGVDKLKLSSKSDIPEESDVVVLTPQH